MPGNGKSRRLGQGVLCVRGGGGGRVPSKADRHLTALPPPSFLQESRGAGEGLLSSLGCTLPHACRFLGTPGMWEELQPPEDISSPHRPSARSSLVSPELVSAVTPISVAAKLNGSLSLLLTDFQGGGSYCASSKLD